MPSNAEALIQQAIRAEYNQGASRLFRINAGQGWVGPSTRVPQGVLIRHPQPFYGAPEGYPDLSGWVSVLVTPDMVGKTLAVAVGVEVKRPGGNRRTAQLAMVRLMQDMGARAGFAESVEQAGKIIHPIV